MVEVVLVRHASTAWSGRRYCGRSDPSLSAAGRAEAAALAAELAPSLAPGTRIISSPLRRALATAEEIAAACGSLAIETEAGGLPIEIDERWREIDFGLAEGRTFEELETIAPAIVAALRDGATDIDWPNGETSGALAARIATAWDDVLAAGGPAVIVTHAGPILHALALAEDRPLDISRLPAPAEVARVTIAVRPASGAPVLPSRA